MSKEKNVRAVLAVWCAYLAPVLLCAVTILLCALPRFYFTYAGITHEGMGLFSLVSNTWNSCQDALDTTGIGPNALVFAYVMLFFTIVFWIGLVWLVILALHSLLCPIFAFHASPTSTLSNRAKKLFGFVWFNHPCYAIFHFIPLVLSFFPQILLAFYDSRLGMPMEITYFGIPDQLILATVTALSLFLFFFTLPLQESLRLDMFRLYKKRSAATEP